LQDGHRPEETVGIRIEDGTPRRRRSFPCVVQALSGIGQDFPVRALVTVEAP
jgi:hypothetical protein